MRCAGTVLLAYALCPAAPATAATVVRMSMTGQLPAGTHVKAEIGAEFQLLPRVFDGKEAEADQATYRRTAKSNTWEFDVPADGRVPERRFDIEFPADLGRVPGSSIGVMTLPIHLWMSSGANAAEKDYTFAVPYPTAGTQLIERCVRISGDIDRLGVETAPDCKDESFLRIRQHAKRQPPKPDDH